MKAYKGRGSAGNPQNRFTGNGQQPFGDGWGSLESEPAQIKTAFLPETTRKVITYNQSPDLPFDRSINPYRGCEHGCSYCYARPTHAYLDLSPGLDFETRIFVKSDLHECLHRELKARGYQCQPIVLGANTDPYQPVEREYRLTRDILEILLAYRHPVSIVTKSALIERDIDLLSEMAQFPLVEVLVSVTTLDKDLARRMEPRAATPARRLQTIERLHAANIPVGILLAPVIPQLNDCEMENILEQVSDRGARSAGYVMLRLPLEVREIFTDWLTQHYPLKADHVMNCLRELRRGKTNDSRFGSRQTGEGPYADIIAQRFSLRCRQLGLNRQSNHLVTHLFRPPTSGPKQLSLFE